MLIYSMILGPLSQIRDLRGDQEVTFEDNLFGEETITIRGGRIKGFCFLPLKHSARSCYKIPLRACGRCSQKMGA